MKGREGRQRVAPGEQFDDRACDVRYVRPLMSHAPGAGIADLPDALTRFDQTLREPVVARRSGAEEVPGTDDEYAATVTCEGLQSAFHLNPDRTLSCQGVLG